MVYNSGDFEPGWCYYDHIGTPYISTCSPTERGARVNYIVSVGGLMVTQGVSGSVIEKTADSLALSRGDRLSRCRVEELVDG